MRDGKRLYFFLILTCPKAFLSANKNSCPEHPKNTKNVLVMSLQQCRHARMANFFCCGALPIKDLCDLIATYSSGFEGTCCLTLKGACTFDSYMVVLPDGRLASCSSGTKIRVWDAATGACVIEFESQGMEVSALAVTPDGKLV